MNNIQLQDLYPAHRDLFNDNAKIAFSKKLSKTPKNAVYLLLRVRNEQAPLAVDQMISIINDLADRQYIKTFFSFGLFSTDYNVISLETLRQPLKPPTESAIFSWPVLTEEGLLYCESHYFHFVFEEGATIPLTEM